MVNMIDVSCRNSDAVPLFPTSFYEDLFTNYTATASVCIVRINLLFDWLVWSVSLNKHHPTLVVGGASMTTV